ncbi:DUF3822 family protein [Flavobacterium sp. LMO8]|uniref:DUF3822 family protein n=1 Tax=Flavobacterium sp. LMO8 TaxID=2654244 RepID=UPI00129091DF|nr:DUF3822 family protein [Flavobacterium sp. LMO8]MQP23995.1 DUF3822 family protein [Flavobacterium sp. LMO8]
MISNLSCKDESEKIIDISTKTEKQNGIIKRSFYKKGKLEKTLEYVNICGKEYLNQGWYFNEKRDTIKSKGNSYEIKIEKSILNPLEESKITFFYKPFLKNTVSGILLCKENNIEYCDLENKKLDTLYFVDNKLEYTQTFRNKGVKNVTGYILEITKELRPNKKYDERKVYFTLNFNVK